MNDHQEQNRNEAPGVTRRRFLSGTGAMLASAASGPLILVPGKARASEQLVVTSWGGAYEAGIIKVFAEPFSKETGMPI
jgi:putative spermidine/putrescine transport system substrate-binding protein